MLNDFCLKDFNIVKIQGFRYSENRSVNFSSEILFISHNLSNAICDSCGKFIAQSRISHT